jgi:prophage regulatory protein
MVSKFCRITEVLTARGNCCRATLYNHIAAGLFPRPLKLNRRANIWPESEVAAVNGALLEGKSEEEIRVLVKQLEARRGEVQ